MRNESLILALVRRSKAPLAKPHDSLIGASFLMSESKRTPGPWKLEVWDMEGNIVVAGQHDARGVYPVAECSNKCLFPGQAEANARLISAAPDLLEALQELVELEVAKNMHKARAAIAKAKGAQ